jgi:hypothetical protein
MTSSQVRYERTKTRMSLEGFSPDSFEQLVRAISIEVFGAGVTVYGNGPDGGREATFRGKVNYPYPPLTTWDGYGVIQAKFKERLESTERDNAWAAKQLKVELRKWQVSTKRIPKPDYYIFCTNVDLTSAHNGGKENLEKLLAEDSASLNLKGSAIWDANQLGTYIDKYQEIRRRFTALLTTGDILAELLRASQQQPDRERILTAYLGREIIADEDARLSQAGDRSEDRIRIADVFTDVPTAASNSPNPVPLAEHDKNEAIARPALQRLLRASLMKLDPLALHELRTIDSISADELQFGRFVFLGGPGSGKSTIGQFLCQIHRSALLDRRPATSARGERAQRDQINQGSLLRIRIHLARHASPPHPS